MAEDEIHALAPFLEERLPALGLDFETYGAYILPLLTDSEEDEEEWETVMELLQASSETHSDDDEAWVQLKKDIEEAWGKHCQEVALQEEKEHVERQKEIDEQIAHEREIAQQAALEQKEKSVLEDKHQQDDDDAKLALVSRFGYEEPDAVDDTEADAPVTNRELAKQLDADKARELRSHKHATKREEQQKTAESKRNKLQAKEERRKRATKGERKR